ncbi:LysR family transcriptional regulator [Microbulbifer sp. S227A]|uniref:LysR family transcriptional regulator n=1 Tax=Microbulbifer sp. S227A TaxID=3415131 RepID=UPI003C7E90CE
MIAGAEAIGAACATGERGRVMTNLVAFQYVLEVARLGSLRLAADRLHVSPSAISRQLAKLEREFGGTLVERRATGVELTEAGRIAAAHFSVIFDQIDMVKGEISELCSASGAAPRTPARTRHSRSS